MENIEHNKSLDQYIILVEFLGKYLGSNYEIILHDLSRMPDTIISIANNELSGRKVGGPITKSALQMLQEEVYNEKEYVINYVGKTGDKTFRSATMFIKDEISKEVIGLLCINFDDSKFEELHKNLFGIIHPGNWKFGNVEKIFDEKDDEAKGNVEEYSLSIDELMQNIYQEAVQDITIPIDYMKQDDRIKVIRDLDRKGMFKLKGSIQYVSEHLKCSQATVYRYLNMISN